MDLEEQRKNLLSATNHWDDIVNFVSSQNYPVQEIPIISFEHVQRQLQQSHGEYLPCIAGAECIFKKVAKELDVVCYDELIGMQFYYENEWNEKRFQNPDDKRHCYLCMVYMVNEIFTEYFIKQSGTCPMTINPFSVIVDVEGEYRRECCLRNHPNNFQGIWKHFRVFNYWDYFYYVDEDNVCGFKERSHVRYKKQDESRLSFFQQGIHKKNNPLHL